MSEAKVSYTVQLQDGAYWATVLDVLAVPARPLGFATEEEAVEEAREAMAREGRLARVVKTTVSVEIIEAA